MRRRLALVMLAVVISACGTTSTEQQTLVAHEAAMETALFDIYQTATVQAERLLVTVEYVNERIQVVGTESGLIVATLQQRGVDISRLPQALTPTPPFNATSAATQIPDVIANQPVPTRDPNATPTRVLITPFATITPRPSPTVEVVIEGPQILQDIVMAPGVGNDDCALNASNSFTPDTQEIYIVARAVELPNQTAITTRWLRAETELVAFDFTYDYIEDACIWFYADQSNFDFDPGSYSVIVEINGLPYGAPIPFSIEAPQ